MTLTTFDRAVRSIYFAHEITPGSPMSQMVDRASGAFEGPVEIVYEVEGGYIVQSDSEAVYLGDDGEVALTDIYEARNPSTPRSIARSFDMAGKSNSAHRQQWIERANQMPDGTNVKGWVKHTLAGDVFWIRRNRQTIDLALEVGTAAVEKALGEDALTDIYEGLEEGVTDLKYIRPTETTSAMVATGMGPRFRTAEFNQLKAWRTKAQAVKGAKAIKWPVDSPSPVHTRLSGGAWALRAVHYGYLSREGYETLLKQMHEGLDENISRSQLASLERAIDKLFAAAKIDVEFTQHFMERVNDARNKKDITIEELAGLFRETWKQHRKTLEHAKPNWNAILQDVSTDINIPIVMDVNQYGEVELVAKTVMRKKNFTGRAKHLRVKSEDVDEATAAPPDLMKGGLGIPRTKMPQIKSDFVPEFLEYLRENGVRVRKGRAAVGTLKPTQDKVSMEKAEALANNAPEAKLRLPVIVSRDRHILDGHHRWAALYARGADEEIGTYEVSVPIRKLLELARGFEKVGYKAHGESIEEVTDDELDEFFGLPTSLLPLKGAIARIVDAARRTTLASIRSAFEGDQVVRFIPTDKEIVQVLKHLGWRKRGQEFVFEELEEGINDRYILKAIFMTGGAGSGKSFISSVMFGGTGLKVVNSDTQLETAMKKAGLDLKKDLASLEVQVKGGIRDQAKTLTNKRLDLYVIGRLGLILDSTAAKTGSVKKRVSMLRALGYDCSMVFVNATLETSLARNQKRARVVPEAIVEKDWKLVQNNLREYRQLFGSKNFRELTNDEVLSPREITAKLTPQLTRMAMPFLNAPVKNPIGQKWMDDQRRAAVRESLEEATVRMLDARTHEVEWEGSVRQFLKDNADNPDTVRKVKRLRPGQSIRLGGGAAPEVIIMRVESVEESLEEEEEGGMSLVEIECLYMDDLADALQVAIQLNPSDVHLVAEHFGPFEAAIEEGEFERAELLFETITKALPLDEQTRMSTHARISRVRNARRGSTKSMQSGAQNRGQVRQENRKKRIARRTSTTSRMKSSRVRTVNRSLSVAREALDAGSRNRLDEAGGVEQPIWHVKTTPAEIVLAKAKKGMPIEIDGTQGVITKISKTTRKTPIFHDTDPTAPNLGTKTRLVVTVTVKNSFGQNARFTFRSSKAESLEESPLGLVKRFLRGSHYTATRDVDLQRAAAGAEKGASTISIKKGDDILVTGVQGNEVSFTHKGVKARMTKKAFSSFELVDESIALGNYEVQQRRRDTPRESHWVGGNLKAAKAKAQELSQTDGGTAYVVNSAKVSKTTGRSKPVAAFSRGKSITVKQAAFGESVDEASRLEQEATALGGDTKLLRKRLEQARSVLTREIRRAFGRGTFDLAGKRLIGDAGLALVWSPVPTAARGQQTSVGEVRLRKVSESVDEGRISSKDPMTMTAGQINNELDKLGGASSKLTTSFIEAGRGHEKFSEIARAKDPLALEMMAVTNRESALRDEGKARYGPKLIGKLPTGKGFGPRKRNEDVDEDELQYSSYVQQGKRRATGFKNFDAARTKAGSWVLVSTNYSKATGKAAAELKLSQGWGTKAVVVAHTGTPPRTVSGIVSLPGKVVATLKASISEDANAHGMEFGERQLIGMYDDEDEATRGTFEEWRATNFSQLDEAALPRVFKGKDVYRIPGNTVRNKAGGFVPAGGYIVSKFGNQWSRLMSVSDGQRVEIPTGELSKIPSGFGGVPTTKGLFQHAGIAVESLDEATGIVLTPQISKEGSSVRMKISGSVGKIEIRGEVRPFHMGIEKEATLRIAEQLTTVNRADEGGKEMPFGAKRKVVAAVHAKLQELHAKHESLDEAVTVPKGAKVVKGVFYFKTSKVAREWAKANGWPTEFIRDFERGYAIQSGNSGSYAGRGPTPKEWKGYADFLRTKGESLDEMEALFEPDGGISVRQTDEISEPKYPGGYGAQIRKACKCSAREASEIEQGMRDYHTTLDHLSASQLVKLARRVKRELGIGESLDEHDAQYKTLNDAAHYDAGYGKGSTEIWYMRDATARTYGMGLDFLRRQESGSVPTKATIATTHKLIGKIKQKNPESVFGMMQGERWSPDGEARTMLAKLGIHHTSMSVGDVIKTGTRVLFVDRNGFTPLD